MRSSSAASVSVTFAFLAAAAGAQQWVPVATAPRYRIGQGMASDPLTLRPLLFGGTAVYNWFAAPVHDADTWRWSGSAWYRCATASAPPAAGPGLPMATDLQRKRVVLLVAAASPAETWEWDGNDWQQRAPAVSPPGSPLTCAMTYDALRGRTVLFDTTAGDQTWEWDGNAWTQVVTAQSPGPRVGFALAFDLTRGRTVLFGGEDGSRQHLSFNDTWEYDGQNWTQSNPAVNPPGRSEHALAWDGAHVLLFGGRNGAALRNDTWTYDGVTWTQQNPATVPPLQVDQQLAFDFVSGRTVLFTAFDTGTGAVPQTWEWDGGNWTLRATPALPPVREMHGLADDAHGRMLLFGGYNAAVSGLGGSTFGDTWLFDGAQWQQAAPLSSPPPRAMFGLATDRTRQRVVLFGGEDGSVRFGDTWEWDGANWAQVAGGGPAARSRLAMTWDAARGVTLLQGGDDGAQSLADTWTWNGAQWQLAPPAAGTPGARTDHALAFDDVRNLVVLHGGQTPTPIPDHNDVWDWNGVQWQQRLPTTPPLPRHFHDFTFDRARQRFLLHGGADQVSADETWEWDGAGTWTLVTALPRPGTATAPGGAYDPVRQRVLLWDGSALWAFTASPAGTSSYGAGCGAGPIPVLGAAGRPFLGNLGFGFEARTAAATPALFFADFAAGSSPLGNCTVLLQSPQPLAFVLADVAGVARLTVPVPPAPVFSGLVLFAQAALLPPAAPIELTNGLRLQVGD